MSNTTPYYPTLTDALNASNANVAELPANAVGVQQHTSTGTINANLRQRNASVWMSQPYKNGSAVCREANLHDLIPDLPQPVRVFCKNGNDWTDVTPPPTVAPRPATQSTNKNSSTNRNHSNTRKVIQNDVRSRLERELMYCVDGVIDGGKCKIGTRLEDQAEKAGKTAGKRVIRDVIRGALRR